MTDARRVSSSQLNGDDESSDDNHFVILTTLDCVVRCQADWRIHVPMGNLVAF